MGQFLSGQKQSLLSKMVTLGTGGKLRNDWKVIANNELTSPTLNVVNDSNWVEIIGFTLKIQFW